MSFLQITRWPNVQGGQPSRTDPWPDRPLSTSGAAASFQTLLLEQMVSELDRTTLTLDATQEPADALSTRWVAGPAVGRGDHREANPSHASRELPRRSPVQTQTPRQVNLPWIGPHAHPQGVAPSLPSIAPAPSPAGPTPGPEAKAGTGPDSAADTFLAKLAGVAKATAEVLGLSPHLLLAQAALETGWGRRSIKDEAGQESHNLFGIKAGKHWAGPTVAIRTTEYTQGRPQTRVEAFRAYASDGEAFADYAKLIHHRYGSALANGATAEGFGQALQAKGYATDPDYARKIVQVAQSVARRWTASS